MKPISKKQPFCDDFSIIESLRLTSTSYFSRLFIVFLLVFSSTLLWSFNAFSVEFNSQQVTVKKAIPAATKIVPPKILKGKIKGKKNKKRVIIKKDTLKDIDPSSISSPLYNN